MLSPEFLEILRCPDDHSKLSVAEAGMLSHLNEQVAAGSLKNRSGRSVEKRLDGALVRATGRLPIRLSIRYPFCWWMRESSSVNEAPALNCHRPNPTCRPLATPLPGDTMSGFDQTASDRHICPPP